MGGDGASQGFVFPLGSTPSVSLQCVVPWVAPAQYSWVSHPNRDIKLKAMQNEESWDILNDDDIDDLQQNMASRAFFRVRFTRFLNYDICHSMQRVSKTLFCLL
jgi:hypothetical protein